MVLPIVQIAKNSGTMKNDPPRPVSLFLPRPVHEVLAELSKCQDDELLFMGRDGNLVSTYGRVINIGHHTLSPS